MFTGDIVSALLMFGLVLIVLAIMLDYLTARKFVRGAEVTIAGHLKYCTLTGVATSDLKVMDYDTEVAVGMLVLNDNDRTIHAIVYYVNKPLPTTEFTRCFVLSAMSHAIKSEKAGKGYSTLTQDVMYSPRSIPAFYTDPTALRIKLNEEYIELLMIN